MESNATESFPPIGFLGLGSMGGAMARTLLKAGYRLCAYDPVPERLDACVSAGAAGAVSAKDAVQRGAIILTSLRTSAMFVQVAEADLLPNARPGQIFMDMGTTEARETRRLAAAFAGRGATLLDTPVSGGPQGSRTGTLRIFVGGDPAAVERCRPILGALGDPGRVVHCGPSGAGQIGKGVNQLAMGLGCAAYLEAIAYGVRAGVDPAALRQAVGGPDGWRAHFDSIARQVVEGRGEKVTVKFPELPYFLNEAAERGFPAAMTEALFAFCDSAPRDWLDNMGRPDVSYWHELLNRPARSGAAPAR